MSNWESELQDQLERDGIPPAQQPARPIVNRLSSKQRRQMQTATAADSSSGESFTRPTIPPLRAISRPIAPSAAGLDDPNTDPSVSQSSLQSPSYPYYPSQSPQPQQPFVHPLERGGDFRPPQTYAQQQQQQLLQQQQLQQQQLQQQRDPGMQRIESSLRDSLAREPLSYTGTQQGGAKQLPPLARPAVPPLKLGEVINKVLGPRALTNPSAAPANVDATKAELRGLVRNMKLTESINPAVAADAHLNDPSAQLEAERAGYLDKGVTLDYDENDDEEEETLPGISGPDGSDEKRPLSPKKNLPTSRIPIDPDDLARKPEELREANLTREELMHFRRNQIQSATTATGSMGSVSNTQQIKEEPKPSPTAAKKPKLEETFVESKTTGEFIRVRQPPVDQSEMNQVDRSKMNIHNIQDFDAHIDTIVDAVNSIQAYLSSFWLLITGILVGACLLQVYLVFVKNSDVDFLSYYSVLAGPSRKVIYVLLGFSVTLSCWRFSLERNDADRHTHFVTRYHIPNASRWIWARNLLCAFTFAFAFLMSLIMVPLDDYMENQFQMNPYWFYATTGLPSYFNDRIKTWYGLCMVRLICVSIGWLCLIHRFGFAEYNFLELTQEKYERRNQFHSTQTFTSTMGAGGNMIELGSRTSRGGGFGETSMPTARNSSRISSQRQFQSTNNGGAMRSDPLSSSMMAVPPRR